jgi:hypothetical protein
MSPGEFDPVALGPRSRDPLLPVLGEESVGRADDVAFAGISSFWVFGVVQEQVDPSSSDTRLSVMLLRFLGARPGISARPFGGSPSGGSGPFYRTLVSAACVSFESAYSAFSGRVATAFGNRSYTRGSALASS